MATLSVFFSGNHWWSGLVTWSPGHGQVLVQFVQWWQQQQGPFFSISLTGPLAPVIVRILLMRKNVYTMQFQHVHRWPLRLGISELVCSTSSRIWLRRKKELSQLPCQAPAVLVAAAVAVMTRRRRCIHHITCISEFWTLSECPCLCLLYWIWRHKVLLAAMGKGHHPLSLTRTQATLLLALGAPLLLPETQQPDIEIDNETWWNM